MIKNAVELVNLQVMDGTQHRLKIDHLKLETGSFTIVLGSSGAGKSTLLKSLVGLEPFANGNATVLGKNLNGLSRRELREFRQQIGYIQQGESLIGRLTCSENVLLGALSSLRLPRVGSWSYPKNLRDKAQVLINSLGIGEFEDRQVQNLSGGQYQRAAIARALIRDPQLILADEPVSALDANVARQIMDIFRAVNKAKKITVLMSLHQINLALEYADRLLVIRNGMIAFDGSPKGADEKMLRELLNYETNL